ncbi:membrane protein [Phocicoccus schoeneichii]|uniref:Sodium-dependent dicarboxylate transporter SdcS n=1 Tax=Phocicoccus schoeneichii TaxID=1812261 RepID=A0A6V7RMJ7_9BACL|nr:DASS family sodium-coupled anion symporter [Jeotgalicoccus schoeneichii]GGH55606.1 membrane protein [Jeotgalicoccus schoeneichii]CAD2079521.1 Citrate carrier [Jeotgalicoccus schoeneichii]
MTGKENKEFKPIWVIVSFAVLIAINLIPAPDDLSVIGLRALSILAFAVIMWVTEAVKYPVSAVMIATLMIVLLGFSPVGELGETLGDADLSGSDMLGTSNALSLAFVGFSTSAVALVAAALFLASAMQITNLHKRMALYVLKVVGNKTNAIVLGTIMVSVILAFFVPSATARAGAVIPILIGMVAAFGLTKQSKLATLLVITAVQAVSIWNVGIKTAAAQNLVAIGFINEAMGQDVSWIEWFIYAAPWSILMSIVLYFTMTRLFKSETSEIEGGREMIQQEIEKLGPIKPSEIRLIIIAGLLLAMWSTEGILHPFDSASVTLIALALMLAPKLGVFTWKQVEGTINWGTIIVFAIGISLGTVLLRTGAAQWLSDVTFGAMGLQSMPLLAVIALVSIFNILIHLGFASATSLASALIPVFIALTTTLGLGESSLGFVLIQQFVICFGFLLPVSAPQNMLAYGTDTFTVQDLLKSGIVLTIVGYILILILSATYWQWIGLI